MTVKARSDEWVRENSKFSETFYDLDLRAKVQLCGAIHEPKSIVSGTLMVIASIARSDEPMWRIHAYDATDYTWYVFDIENPCPLGAEYSFNCLVIASVPNCHIIEAVSYGCVTVHYITPPRAAFV